MRMRFFLILLFLFSLCACSPHSGQEQEKIAPNSFGKIEQTPTKEHPKEIVIVTHAGPNTYFINADNQYAGLEYDLANLLVKKYAPEYKVKFLVVNQMRDVMPTLLSGKADIAAAGLEMTSARKKLVTFSAPYHQAQDMLVYNQLSNSKPAHLTKIQNKKLVVAQQTSAAEHLHALSTKMPALIWQEENAAAAEILLSKVAQGKLDFTIANNHLVDEMQNYYPNLQTALPIGKTEKIAWAFSPKADKRLIKKINQFFARIKQDGNLRNLLDRYYGHAERLDATDITTFLERVETTLPKYKHLFKNAEAQTGLNWRLLAALSYRESHWDTNSTSPTNVRGLMMLTENTAQAMGVTDRLDPEQSVPAGAKYILEMKGMFPKTIPDPDRTYFALAAYNIGYSHVQDARVLAKRMQLNQDSWADIKKTLQLLNDPEFYNSVNSGYASGGAPVVFVETVRSYERILEKYQPSHKQINSKYFFAVQ